MFGNFSNSFICLKLDLKISLQLELLGCEISSIVAECKCTFLSQTQIYALRNQVSRFTGKILPKYM